MLRQLSKQWIAIALFGLLPHSAVLAAEPSQLLGPTGLYGEFDTWPPPPKEHIVVTKVEENSPASGKLKVGDVIVGVGDQKFVGNPQPMLAQAINEAETEEAGGKLTLLLKTGEQVVIQIPVLGRYSATAPYDCPKTEKIIDQALQALLKDKRLGEMPTRSELLALMATGEKQHIELVGKLIRERGLLNIDPVAVDDMLNGGKDMGTVGWFWGYNLITLGEYYLLTKDDSVLPAMRIYAMGLARGQDASATWGHRMATTRLNGRLPGYAQMNQPSLTNFMGMIIAKKCGIDDPVLNKAIEKTYAYVADHVDKGAFPYGIHGPSLSGYNNNGTSGSAAICLSLKGNQHGASYFSQLAATSYDALTSGHASAYFNALWTPLGTGLSGPEVTHEFFMKSQWYFTLNRHWKGAIVGGDRAGMNAAQTLLMYCLPRKALLITGREADPSIYAKGPAADEIIMRSKLVAEAKSVDELIKLLDHPYSQVSRAVAEALLGQIRAEKMAKKPDTITPKLLAVIDKGNPRERKNAISCFIARFPRDLAGPHVDRVGGILRDKNEPTEIRLAAASALGSGCFDVVAGPYYNDVLQLMFEPRSGNDPFSLVDVQLAQALYGISSEPLTQNLVADKELFYRASVRLMEHKRQNARAVGISMLRGISIQDFPVVADKLMYTIENKDPTYQSYHNVQDTVAPGVEVLASLNIKEGLDILLTTVSNPEGKFGFKMKMLFDAIPRYGGNAQPYITKFETNLGIDREKPNRFRDSWLNVIKLVEEDKNPKKLISFEEAKQGVKAE